MVNLINLFMGWPLVVIVISASLLCTIALGFVQFRFFVSAWRYFFSPSEHTKETKAAMSPFQALINVLNSNLGNGIIAGMGTALCAGGPGAVFWLLIIGLLLMAVRFAEIFLSLYYGRLAPAGTRVGGPMIYLAQVSGRRFLPFIYALAVFCYGLVGANLLQVNSITLSVQEGLKNLSFNPTTIAITLGFILCAFVIYVLVGGAQRILDASEKIVPLKIALFVFSTIIILVYWHASIMGALQLMISCAFKPCAFAGGVIGFTVQQAMVQGISRIVFSSEAGLGTSAILFGATASKHPVKDAIMSMLSTFITTIIAFVLALSIVATGVWNNGLASTALTMSAFNTVFGSLVGAILVIFLALSFGIGAIVAFAYIARETWIFLTGGKALWLFSTLYAGVAFIGCIMPVSLVWDISNILTITVLMINLYAIVYLLPTARNALCQYTKNGYVKVNGLPPIK